VSEDPPYRSLLLVPMQVRQAKTAVLGVMNKLGDDFMSPDVKMAKAIADYAGAQIENVLLFQASVEQTRLQTEMELAQQVQLHLLPRKPPNVAGLDLWAATKPASQVGGDFYDFIVTSDQPFAFAVGDISGKGMPAALLMAMTRTVLRTKLNAVPMPTPEEIIGWSNAELYDDFTEVSMFATVCLGQYYPETQTLVYGNAGHSPVIYCPANGPTRLLEADGTAMGILPVSFSQNQTIQLHPGDVFILGTDGLNEAHNEQGEMFGYDRLLKLISSSAHKSAEEIAHGIYTAVREFGTGELQDDQTLLILKCVHP
jgi:sigma-B regulation protein RsbU (phosphoserine phosphatase)